MFGFSNELYLQNLGTAFGTKMGPSYANIFMAVLEQELLAKSQINRQIKLRYIDNAFMIWNHGVNPLYALLRLYLYQHTTIKLPMKFHVLKLIS